MIATFILVVAMFTSSIASGPSVPQSYGGYNQHQQMYQQQYQPQQQQERWRAEVSQTSYGAETSTSTTESETPSEGTESSPLPEGWSEHFDPNSNQYYYYNAADGTTSWDRPENPSPPDQKAVESERKEENSVTSEPKPESAEATPVLHNPEQDREQNPQDPSVGGFYGMNGKDTAPRPSSEYESWQSNKDLQMNQPESNSPNKIQPQPTNWGGHGQSDRIQTDDHGPPQSSTQHSSGSQWAHSNSTEPSVVGGDTEIQNNEFQGQPTHMQHVSGESARWGMPREIKGDESPERPWGVEKPPEQRYQNHMALRKPSSPGVPSKETQGPPTGLSKDTASSDGRWEASTLADKSSVNERFQSTDPSYSQRQAWQESHPASRTEKSPESQRRPPVEGIPPHSSRAPPHQYPQRPHYLSRPNYPPQYGSYNPNTPPGQGQHDPKYGGQNLHGRGYPPQQPPHSQPNIPSQIVSQGTEVGTSTVKEALSTTWKGLLGFGNKTREVVGTARDQVVTGATAAGQSLSAKSSSIWESAKSTVGGVFENSDPGQSSYTLSGYKTQNPPENRPSYPGRPNGPNQGYPNVPGGPGGQGPPPRTFGGQQPGRYGPQVGQQPRYGGAPRSGYAEPPGRPQSPSPYQQSQQMRPPGHPNMQPRRDNPYPQPPQGQERGPMQSQYGNQSNPQQSAQGTYPPMQQRPPYSGPPQSDTGHATTQSAPQQKQQPDPWDHPGLTGEY